ncbi:MAG: VCBS repeat-containing protein [Planctomycetales bacterium]|nr:VCBS repeat-containing protein [Planctomycetales bacterium]
MIHHRITFAVVLCALWSGITRGEEHTLHTFERQRLTDVYYSEGATAGDLNQDGQADVVYGPYWFAGPDFKEKHELYPPAAQNREGYADNFFSWIYDFNGDGRPDIFVVGFPGTPAYVYENPGSDGWDKHWPKHQVFDWVSNESPQLTNIYGDERPELVCTRDGFFGFATVDWDKPFEAWTFHPVSVQIAASRFGHGLGIGDVNGDGRPDILHAQGWFEQPANNAADSRWKQHDVKFTSAYGGAEMYAYDVDGDGDNDIITSDAAHDFGLGWYEQVASEDGPTFQYHEIMGDHPADNMYGVLFTEPHSVNLVDIDGDGLKDIVTGKTFYSHHRQSPMWDAGAVVYWFRLTRGDDGVQWIPYQADGEAGIGRQVSVVEITGDGLPDIVVGGMKGAHVLRHQVRNVSAEEWEQAQPQVYDGPPPPSAKGAEARRGPSPTIDANSGTVTNAIEGESLTPHVSAGQARAQEMQGFSGSKWSGNGQLFWTGAQPGDVMEIPVTADEAGDAELEIVFTCARDYGVVQLSFDDQQLGEPLDFYNSGVISSGVLNFPLKKLAAGKHTLKIQVVGTHPQAVKAYMVGLDYLRLKP